MVRTAPSAADQEILDELSSMGVTWISEYQLERWRLARALPPPFRRGLGRGRGSTSRYPAEALPIAALLACRSGQGRPLDEAVLDLWRVGVPFPDRGVREALTRIAARIERWADRVRASGPAAMDKTVARARRKITPYDPALLAFNLEDRPAKSTLRKRAARRRELQDAKAMSVDLFLYGDVPTADLIVDQMRLLGFSETADVIEPGLIAEELSGPSDLLGEAMPSDLLSQLIRSLSLRTLLAARKVVNLWAFINLHLMFGLIDSDPMKDLVRTIATDEGTQWFRQNVGLPVGPGLFATALVHTASLEPILESGWEYGLLLLPWVAAVVAETIEPRLKPGEEATLNLYRQLSNLDPTQPPQLYSEHQTVDLELLESEAEHAIQRRLDRELQPGDGDRFDTSDLWATSLSALGAALRA